MHVFVDQSMSTACVEQFDWLFIIEYQNCVSYKHGNFSWEWQGKVERVAKNVSTTFTLSKCFLECNIRKTNMMTSYKTESILYPADLICQVRKVRKSTCLSRGDEQQTSDISPRRALYLNVWSYPQPSPNLSGVPRVFFVRAEVGGRSEKCSGPLSCWWWCTSCPSPFRPFLGTPLNPVSDVHPHVIAHISNTYSMYNCYCYI